MNVCGLYWVLSLVLLSAIIQSLWYLFKYRTR